MRRFRIRARLAAISVFLAAGGCGTAPSNSLANESSPAEANALANGDSQNSLAEPITPKMPKAPDLSTLEGRTEAAIIDQLSCRKLPEAAKAISAMLRNGLLKETDDGGDGSIVYAPKRRLFVFGFPLLHVTGWQKKIDSGDGMPPFVRGPGTPPPNFFEVTVQASPRQVRSAIRALGIREERYQDDPRREPVTIDGKFYQPQQQILGIRVTEGDMDLVSAQKTGVTTLACSTYSP